MEKKISFKTACAIALGWRFGNFLADFAGEAFREGVMFAHRYAKDPDEAAQYFKETYIDKKPKKEIKMGFM